jgi:HlyD family secretion protein
VEEEQFRIEEGASVRQGQELFYFPDLTKMEVVALLNETVVSRVRGGMPARIRFEGTVELAYVGRVESVESLPKRTYNDVPYYPCRITLEAAPPGLLPGKSAEVEIQVGRCYDSLAIPCEAVSLDQDRSICWVIGPSGLERREITPGGSNSNLIEVADGLREGEVVVLSPISVLDGLADGTEPAAPDHLKTDALSLSP